MKRIKMWSLWCSWIKKLTKIRMSLLSSQGKLKTRKIWINCKRVKRRPSRSSKVVLWINLIHWKRGLSRGNLRDLKRGINKAQRRNHLKNKLLMIKMNLIILMLIKRMTLQEKIIFLVQTLSQQIKKGIMPQFYQIISI